MLQHLPGLSHDYRVSSSRSSIKTRFVDCMSKCCHPHRFSHQSCCSLQLLQSSHSHHDYSSQNVNHFCNALHTFDNRCKHMVLWMLNTTYQTHLSLVYNDTPPMWSCLWDVVLSPDWMSDYAEWVRLCVCVTTTVLLVSSYGVGAVGRNGSPCCPAGRPDPSGSSSISTPNPNVKRRPPAKAICHPLWVRQPKYTHTCRHAHLLILG